MEVLELLVDLARKGVKLSLEGSDLGCYAPKGSLTAEVKDSILKNKPEIVEKLMDYIDFKAALTASGSGKKISASRGQPAKAELNLEAEAILDPGIQPSAVPCDVDFANAKTVLLTGASGFLGAYLLHELMTATEARVHCLVRCSSADDGRKRIEDNLLKYQLWRDDFASRIAPVPGDLALPFLGMPSDQFEAFSNTIDTVYHNGAVVNFIYSYGSLKLPNVRGTEEVIRLASRGRRKPLHFISTIGVFPPTMQPEVTVLESDPSSQWRQLTAGYPQTKWVAEKLVTVAAERGLPVRIYRPGFVSGDTKTGIWNTDDFLARMITGCIQLGSAPDIDATVEMVPVDYVSKTIVHLSRQKQLSSTVFHIVGQHRLSLRELFSLVGSLGYQLTMVPYADWRKALFDDAKVSSNNALFPLLTGFTDGPPLSMPVFDCRHTLNGLQGTQIECPRIDRDLISVYLSYFKNCGFLDMENVGNLVHHS